MALLCSYLAREERITSQAGLMRFVPGPRKMDAVLNGGEDRVAHSERLLPSVQPAVISRSITYLLAVCVRQYDTYLSTTFVSSRL